MKSNSICSRAHGIESFLKLAKVHRHYNVFQIYICVYVTTDIAFVEQIHY